MKLTRFSWPLMANSLVAASRRHWLRMSRSVSSVSGPPRRRPAERVKFTASGAERQPSSLSQKGSSGSTKVSQRSVVGFAQALVQRVRSDHELYPFVCV